MSLVIFKSQTFVDAHEKLNKRPQVCVGFLVRIFCRLRQTAVDEQMAEPMI